MLAPLLFVLSSASAADVVAPAWDGLAITDLGRLYDADFDALPGHLPGASRVTELGQMARDFRRVESETELAACVRAWGFGSASGTSDAKTSYGFFRAVEKASLAEWELPEELGDVDEGAAYYLRGIHVGRLYEVTFSGSDSAIQGAVHADLGAYGGDVSGWASANQVTFSIRGVGLQGKDGSAIFAKTEADIADAYQATGDVRPILAVFAPVPRKHLQVVEAAAPPTAYDVAIGKVKAPRTSRSGDDWDVMGGAPDLSLWIKAGSQVLYRSPVAEDTFSYAFNALALRAVDVAETPMLTVTLSDSDLRESDLIARWNVSLLKLEAAGGRLLLDDGGGASVELGFGPVK